MEDTEVDGSVFIAGVELHKHFHPTKPHGGNVNRDVSACEHVVPGRRTEPGDAARLYDARARTCGQGRLEPVARVGRPDHSGYSDLIDLVVHAEAYTSGRSTIID